MPSRIFFIKNLIFITTWLLIFLFVYAAISKLLDYQKFEVQLGQSPVLTQFSGLVAWLIPVLEIMISILLYLPKCRIFGLYAAFTLMMIFTAYIIIITSFSPYVPCSCGGILQKMNWNQHLAFNLIFVALSVLSIAFYQPLAVKTHNSR